jgi:starch phosphorylase
MDSKKNEIIDQEPVTVDRIQVDRIKEDIEMKLQRLYARTLKTASDSQLYKAMAMALRDKVMEKWAYSKEQETEINGRQLYYLSMEFLMGRLFGNNLMNLGLEQPVLQACQELGIDLEKIRNSEPDAGLGNGGLGRLAACFLDSLATLGMEGHGNGIRYEYGLFKQKIVNGFQVEVPDPWLEDGNVWEIAKPEEPEIVCFGGEVERVIKGGKEYVMLQGAQCVKAIPYDMPVLGYDSEMVNTLRLWGARALKPMDMGLFGQGRYVDSLAEKELAEVISKVLYPEDNHPEGKALRLKQQYFFVSASVQSIHRKFKDAGNNIFDFHKKVVIHINDTHPALAIPELMRILMDKEGLDWEDAWGITRQTFAYTNHTILEEALERWPEDLFRRLLPRIYEIIHEINEQFCGDLWKVYPGEWEHIARMAIISENEIHMARLCIAGSFSVNGVAKLHTEILKNEVFKDFYQLEPQKFRAITNGVTHRRFLLKANPKLAHMITDKIGDSWIKQPSELIHFKEFAGDLEVQQQLAAIRHENKEKLAGHIFRKYKIALNPDAIFDVQVKRLHEYKRQLLNVMHIMFLYNKIIGNNHFTMHPRVFIFGAKAAPGYHNAKMIIKLIHTLAKKVNNDPRVKDQIKVIFMENYRVSLAERIIPASDVSEQISTAGKEASGTGNMKFMLNGALTIGTLDGANVEMMEAVGIDNMYIFGLTADEVASYYQTGHYRPYELYQRNPDLKQVLDQLVDGFLEPEHPEMFQVIYNSLLYGHYGMADPYFLLKDFEPYCLRHTRLGKEYAKPEIWWEKAIINIAHAGEFSSDRTIRDYNEQIWKLPVYPPKKKGDKQ